MRTFLLPLLAACSGPAAEDSATEPATGCNGHDVLCQLPFDEVAVAMTHNAMSSAEDDWLAPNQTYAMPRQLEDGVRGFMIDTHYDDDGTPALCHGFCSIGSTPLVDGLRQFTDFLDAHPREVVVFMIENGISAEDTAAAFEAADLLRYTYAHDPQLAWPTLGELVEADTRLIVFHQGGGTDPAWYMDGYADYVWDTDYSAETAADFDCGRLRGSSDHALFLMNHFLTAPLASPDLAEQVNHNPLLLDRARQCEAEAGQAVNWIAVDFYDIGDVLAVVDTLNGVDAL
ncbi:MAG: phosphatidylinositol-specific phospholipase C domain-containing protein [Deltaproteobacteria bacterium]|nr:MAG: phosphatidylinositol-specific phospholipase C domain-containing protein [Deltaproteobacteria bacterium]